MFAQRQLKAKTPPKKSTFFH
jgi:hypothetical protein